LRQAIATLLADHLELIGRQALNLGHRQRNAVDRHAQLVEKRQRFGGGIGSRHAASVRRYRLTLLGSRRLRRNDLCQCSCSMREILTLAILADRISAENRD